MKFLRNIDQQKLDRQIKGLEVKKGISKHGLGLIKCEMDNEKDPKKHLFNLMFDDVHLQKKMEYCPIQKKVIGPCTKAMVVMIRQLYGDYKKVLYTAFDKDMCLQLIKDLIVELENVGAKIIMSTFDLGNPKFKADLKFKELENDDIFCFENPVDPTRKVYCFADSPHLIKLIRNHLIDGGYQLDDDEIFKLSDIEALKMLHDNNEWLRLYINAAQKMSEQEATNVQMVLKARSNENSNKVYLNVDTGNSKNIAMVTIKHEQYLNLLISTRHLHLRTSSSVCCGLIRIPLSRYANAT